MNNHKLTPIKSTSTLIEKKNSGYTLIEILIALFVFSIFGLMTSTIIGNMLTNKQTTQNNLSGLDKLQFATTLIDQDFRQILNYQVTNPGGKKIPPLIGQEHEIGFYRGGNINPNAAQTRSTISHIRYALENNYLCRYTSFNLNPRSPNDRKEVKLCLLSNINKLTFSYLSEGLTKSSTWQKDKPPTAISITIEHKDLEKIPLFYALPNAMKFSKKGKG